MVVRTFRMLDNREQFEIPVSQRREESFYKAIFRIIFDIKIYKDVIN